MDKHKNVETATDRFRQAVDARGWSLREFHRRAEPIFKDGSVRGGSYATLIRYMSSPKKDPPARFLHVAASVLNVRPEWLIEGSGEMTAAEQTLRADEYPLDDALRKAAPGIYRMGGPPIISLFHLALQRLVAACADQPTREQTAELGAGLATLIELPTSYLTYPPNLGFRRIMDYYTAQIHALMILMPPRGAVPNADAMIALLNGTYMEWAEANGVKPFESAVKHSPIEVRFGPLEELPD